MFANWIGVLRVGSTGAVSVHPCASYPNGTDLVIQRGPYPGNVPMIVLTYSSIVAVGVYFAPGAIIPYLIRGDGIVPSASSEVWDTIS